ncbi:MAG: STAS domain-containing protein [Syntrophobacteraceae bacterium]
MQQKTERQSGAKVVTLEGDLTIQRANELKECLLEALHSSKQVLVDLAKATSVDLSCLQILCSAHRTALKLGKSLALEEGFSEGFKQAVRDLGYKRNRSCLKDGEACCLWVGGWR